MRVHDNHDDDDDDDDGVDDDGMKKIVMMTTMRIDMMMMTMIKLQQKQRLLVESTSSTAYLFPIEEHKWHYDLEWQPNEEHFYLPVIHICAIFKSYQRNSHNEFVSTIMLAIIVV